MARKNSPSKLGTSGKPSISVQIKPSEIICPKRMRALQPEAVAAIAESFEAVGQLQPIVVRVWVPPWVPSEPGKTDHMARYILVAGAHRLAAAKRLGWETIGAIVLEFADADAELAEIDENLRRALLSPAERKLHIGRRKELYEAEHPETRHGAVGRGGKRSKDVNSFVDDTAAKTGRGRSTIARDARHSKTVAVLGEIIRTPLDSDAEIERLPADEQHKLAEQAKVGLEVTAKPIPPAPVPPPSPPALLPVSPLPNASLAELLRRLHAVLRKAAAAEIKEAIAEIGPVPVHEVIAKLKGALNEHSAGNAVQAAADRIEAQSRAATSDDLSIPPCLDRRRLN